MLLQEALTQIISPKVVLPIQKDQSKCFLVVEETGTDSKIKRLIITDLEENSFAFTLDHKAPCFKQLSAYFNSTNEDGINKSCDLVLFTQFKASWYVLILELKSNAPKLEPLQLQLQNSELFIRYIGTLIQAYYPQCNIKLDTMTYQKTFITTRQRPGPVKQNNKPSFDYLPVAVQVDGHQKATVRIGKLLGV